LLKTTTTTPFEREERNNRLFFRLGWGFVVWLIFHLILAALIVFGYHDELETVPGVDVAAAAAFDVVHTSPESLVSGPRALNSI
jgi:hypothetical protein